MIPPSRVRQICRRQVALRLHRRTCRLSVAHLKSRLSIVPSYWTCWGWWHLSGPVSTSPLETFNSLQCSTDATCESERDGLTIDTRVRYGSHATVTEQRESDAPERLSCRPTFDETLHTTAGGQDSSNDIGPNRPSYDNGISSNTSIVGPTRPDDGTELQTLHPEASSTSRMLSDQGTTGRASISSDPSEGRPETQADSSSERAQGTGSASPRIRTRVEMKLKFAEE
jgi:hypothetical protein